MKQLQPVLWTKGTFLTPQHLQAQDRFLEDSIHFRLSALKSSGWGFSEFIFDEEALAGGECMLTRAAGIFPDGLLFDLPASDSAPPSKALADYFEPGVRELDIYLGVPAYRDAGVNVGPLGTSSGARFTAEITTVPDENTGAGEKPIQVARKNLRLLAGTESREGFTTLHVAKIERDASGIYKLNPRFAPPLLDVRANGYLQGLIDGLLEKLFAKSTQLAAGRRQKNQSLADFTSSDIANFWLLYTVNTHIPALNHFNQGRRCHPDELFSAMTALAASLTTFSTTIRPRDLPLYDHQNLSTVFSDLDAKLRLLLDTVIPTTVVTLPLKLTKNSIYATAIDRDKYFQKSRMYLAVAAEIAEELLISKVPQLVKVCSAARIDQLITSALTGIQLTHLSVPPAAIPVKMKHQYFSLSQSGAAWEALIRDRSLAAHVPGEFPNPELELIIVLPEAE